MLLHLTIAIKNEAYKLRATQYHNAKVKNRRFKFGDLVPRKLEATDNIESQGKLASKQDDHFKVIRVIKSNAYHLKDIEGKNISHVQHLDHLKMYIFIFLSLCIVQSPRGWYVFSLRAISKGLICGLPQGRNSYKVPRDSTCFSQGQSLKNWYMVSPREVALTKSQEMICVLFKGNLQWIDIWSLLRQQPLQSPRGYCVFFPRTIFKGLICGLFQGSSPYKVLENGMCSLKGQSPIVKCSF